MKNTYKYIYSIVLQLIVVAMLVVGNGAKAQYPYNFSFAGVPLDSKTIVRSYDGQRVVVYYEESGKGYVSLVNVILNDAYTVPLDPRYSMNDMCIMNDSIFLCGQENATDGCIVSMSLDSFYTSSVLVTYFFPSYWMNMNPTRINVFKYQDIMGYWRAKFFLVCDIGYACDDSEPFPSWLGFHNPYYIDSNSHSRCWVNAVAEVSYPFTISASYSPSLQKILRIMNPQNHSETIHDVVVTDNYVAFVGVESGTNNSITLHICNKDNDVLKTTTNIASDFDDYYIYPLGTGSGNPFYHACALDGDMIAIVTQDELSTSSNEITIRTIDLTTHTMLNTQTLQCNIHPYLKDVAYIPNLQQLVLLHNGYFRPTYTYCDIFSLVNPYNTNPSYVLPGIKENVFNHNKFVSLDAMTGNYFITTGGKYGFATDAGNWSTGRMCYDVEDYIIIKQSVINADTASFNYDQHLLHAAVEYQNAEPVHVVLPIHCINK